MSAKLYFYTKIFLVLPFFAAHASKQVFLFDFSTLVKQDTNARKQLLLKRLQESYGRKNYSTMALWRSIRQAFDVNFFCNEREVKRAFYKFLQNIPVPVNCPTITFESEPLPPLITAWNLGRIDTQKAMQLADEYIDKQQYNDNNKKFYHAMIYITFDPTVAQTTKFINEKAKKIADSCHAKGYCACLVGHCDKNARTWLQEQHADLLNLFNKILFSHEIEQLPQREFDDAWWLEHLGVAKSEPYAYVTDWRRDGSKGDEPPHYATTSKELQKLLK